MTGLLADACRRQAESREHAVAVVTGVTRLTYGELERASNRLARQLLASGCRRGDRVCLFVEKSPAAIVAQLACLKAGAAYVPIDLGSPPARLARIVGCAEPRLALVSAAGAAAWTALQSTKTPKRLAGAAGIAAALDEGAAAALGRSAAFAPQATDGQSAEPAPVSASPHDIAHILFTSGSTGEPKGVPITHANVQAFLDWAVPHFAIGASDRLSGHPPLHFDLSTFDVYGAMRAGAELHLVPGDLVMARQLADFIAGHALTQWFSVPSAMTFMARFGGLPEQGFPSLKRVLWCGEVLPTAVLVEWMQRLPQARFTNLYGPTETTIASSYHDISAIPADATRPVAIGRACGGEELFLIADDGRPPATGELGEIHIAGTGVSPGYWRDAASARAAFVADPRGDGTGSRCYRTGDLAQRDADGLLHFAGRRDAQIKSRGYRIELGEIEAAVTSLGTVAQCAVVAIPAADFAGTAICCAWTPAPGSAADLLAVRAALRELLPAYMLPSKWRRLDALPANGNGKIDRPALARLFADTEASRPAP